MTTVWLVLITLVGAGVSVTVGDLVSKEIRGRLDALPRAVLLLAGRRLPDDLRAERIAEWQGELHEILRGAEALPVTRLWLGLRYAAGIVRAAPSVARALSVEDQPAGPGKHTRELSHLSARIGHTIVVSSIAVTFSAFFALLAVMAMRDYLHGGIKSPGIALCVVAAAVIFFVAVPTFILAGEALAQTAEKAAGLAVAAVVALVHYSVSTDIGSDAYDYIGLVGGYLVGFSAGGYTVSWVARRLRAALQGRRPHGRLDATQAPSSPRP